MKKILLVVVFLGLIGAVLWRLQSRPVSPVGKGSKINAEKDTSENLERCTCGSCDLDIFSCICPTAKKQRDILGQ